MRAKNTEKRGQIRQRYTQLGASLKLTLITVMPLIRRGTRRDKAARCSAISAKECRALGACASCSADDSRIIDSPIV